MVLSPGTAVPTVRADNQAGDRLELAFETPTVLYFYPEDGTPGCTSEAEAFEARYDAFADGGAEIYGVSPDSVDSHAAFADEHDLSFDLLSDPEGNVAEAFGVDLVNGRPKRTTFVLARGQVVGVYEGVRPSGHATDVLRDLAESGLVEPVEASEGS
ncbi:peroxiredoxin [Haloarcula litorea]|uniref:peroxiredoxin n=1 Tax=Haloarcula litorea TaxID=3032579 RepID=UPI0023E760A4|nr:peroxiredoxin [Halomicroarcula sp. GDY20]